jgi:hypothetical protein
MGCRPTGVVFSPVHAYALASASGLVFAFYFFLALSAFVGLAVYVLLTQPSSRRSQLGLGTVRKWIALTIALLVWCVVFAGIYLTSLAGFHHVSLDDDGVRLEYAMPSRSLMVPYDDLGDVMRRPAYRQQWHLEIYTWTGTRFQSAPGSYAEVKSAAEALDQRRSHQ